MKAFQPSKKIQIILEKDSFSPGENIEGRVILKLDKPAHARGVFLTIYSAKAPSRTERKYEFESRLDEEKEYRMSEEYKFRLMVPDFASKSVTVPAFRFGPLSFGKRDASTEIWFLEAKLDSPLQERTTNKIRII